MILKFTDVTDPNYLLEVFQDQQNVTFQTTCSENKTTDVTIDKENLYDLIGVLLTIQAKLKGAR